MRILVGVNCLTSVSAEVYGSHCNFWYRLGKDRPQDEFIFLHPRRLSIDHMRNEAARLAMANECSHVLFIDDDVIITPNTLTSLLKRDKDIIMALTFLRGYPFKPMLFKEIYRDNNGDSVIDFYDNYEEKIDKDGLVEAAAVGFSCALIKVDLLKKIPPPFFITGKYHTEDVYFCVKAKKFFPETSIFVDTTVPTGHLLDSEAVNTKNVKQLRKYYEEFVQKEGSTDMDPEIIRKSLAVMDATK